MSIISKETWDKFTEEEKKKLRNTYKILDENNSEARLAGEYEYVFGKENLQPEVKTWKDVQDMNEDSNFFMRIDDNLELSDKVYSKCIATLKIAKLIELGYGGMITEEEWKENGHDKGFYSIWADAKGKIECTLVYDSKEFIAFHTKQQAEEFMSYPENRAIIEQYFMI